MQSTPDQQPVNYLGRKFQLRRLSMVALLGLVLVAIDRASQPSSWYWLTAVSYTHLTLPTICSV